MLQTFTALVHPKTRRENNHWAPCFKHLLPWSIPKHEEKTITEFHASNIYCPGPSQNTKRKQSLSSMLQTFIALVHPKTEEKTITELHASNIYCPGPSQNTKRKQSLSSMLQTFIALVHPKTWRENNHWVPCFKHLLPWSIPKLDQKTITELHTSNIYCPGPSQNLTRKQSLSSMLQTSIALARIWKNQTATDSPNTHILENKAPREHVDTHTKTHTHNGFVCWVNGHPVLILIRPFFHHFEAFI